MTVYRVGTAITIMTTMDAMSKRSRFVCWMMGVAMLFSSCNKKQKPQQNIHIATPEEMMGFEVVDSCVVEVPAEAETHETESRSTVSSSHSQSSSGTTHVTSDYFQQGYDDGYRDGCSLEKGRSYDNTLSGEDAREYRRGYFAGYPDGRADSDPDDEYVTGRNNADYYDTRDDDDWSENGDFDDDDDGW